MRFGRKEGVGCRIVMGYALWGRLRSILDCWFRLLCYSRLSCRLFVLRNNSCSLSTMLNLILRLFLSNMLTLLPNLHRFNPFLFQSISLHLLNTIKSIPHRFQRIIPTNLRLKHTLQIVYRNIRISRDRCLRMAEIIVLSTIYIVELKLPIFITPQLFFNLFQETTIPASSSEEFNKLVLGWFVDLRFVILPIQEVMVTSFVPLLTRSDSNNS